MVGEISISNIVPLASGLGIIIVGSILAVWIKRYKQKLRNRILRNSNRQYDESIKV